jgi:hypothetical protein
MPPGDGAGRQGAGRHADDEDRNRQGGEGRARRQHMADDRAGGVDDDRVGAGERLGDGEPRDIAARMVILRHIFRFERDALGNLRHDFRPWDFSTVE